MNVKIRYYLIFIVLTTINLVTIVNANQDLKTTLLSSSSSSLDRTTPLFPITTDGNNIPRKLVLRLSQQQQQHQQQHFTTSEPKSISSTSTTSKTTAEKLGRTIFDLREPFSSFQQDDDSDQQQQINNNNFNDLSNKLNTMIELIETSFTKTMERIDELENKWQIMQTTFLEYVHEFIEKNQKESIKDHDSSDSIKNNNNNNNYHLILNKLYNIHQQTYQVCKSALVLPKDNVDSNCPTMTAVCSMIKHYRNDKYPESSSSLDLNINNGSNNNSKNKNKNRNYRDHRSTSTSNIESTTTVSTKNRNHLINSRNNHQELDDDDLDGEAMREVFGLFANWTLDQYVQRMHRNVAEELNVFNFQMKEKFQHLLEKINKMDLIVKSTDQLSSSFIDIRDQLYEEHSLIDKISEQLQSLEKKDFLNYNNNNYYHNNNKNIENKECSVINNNNETDVQIKELLNEYYNKFVNHLNGSLIVKTIKTSSKRQTSPDHMMNTNDDFESRKFIIYEPLSFSSSLPEQLSKSISLNDDRKNKDFVVIKPPIFEPITRTKKERTKCSREANVRFPDSCYTLKKNGATCNGVYIVLMNISSLMKPVYCDMINNNGGWTVILRRGEFLSSKYLLNFNQTYEQYRIGFGDMHAGEFWIGLQFLNEVTKNGSHLLQIDLLDYDDNFISLVYDGFSIGSSEDGYRFYVKSFRKNLSLSNNPNWNLTDLASIVLPHNNTQFITIDYLNKNLDKNNNNNNNNNNRKIMIEKHSFYNECATKFSSGWWYLTPTWSSIYNNLSIVDICRHLNKFQLMAPLKLQNSLEIKNKTFLTIEWNKWYDDNEYKERKLRYIIMKIRPENVD